MLEQEVVVPRRRGLEVRVPALDLEVLTVDVLPRRDVAEVGPCERARDRGAEVGPLRQAIPHHELRQPQGVALLPRDRGQVGRLPFLVEDQLEGLVLVGGVLKPHAPDDVQVGADVQVEQTVGRVGVLVDRVVRQVLVDDPLPLQHAAGEEVPDRGRALELADVVAREPVHVRCGRLKVVEVVGERQIVLRPVFEHVVVLGRGLHAGFHAELPQTAQPGVLVEPVREVQ